MQMKLFIAENLNLLTGKFLISDKTTRNGPKRKSVSDILKDSQIVFVTLIFVLLYKTAFAGKVDPLKDSSMLLRLELIIFILIGYYFARIPARQNEILLKEEIARQTQKNDAAQFAKEKAQLEGVSLEEKIRNFWTALKNIVLPKKNNHQNVPVEALRGAAGILDS